MSEFIQTKHSQKIDVCFHLRLSIPRFSTFYRSLFLSFVSLSMSLSASLPLSLKSHSLSLTHTFCFSLFCFCFFLLSLSLYISLFLPLHTLIFQAVYDQLELTKSSIPRSKPIFLFFVFPNPNLSKLFYLDFLFVHVSVGVSPTLLLTLIFFCVRVSLLVFLNMPPLIQVLGFRPQTLMGGGALNDSYHSILLSYRILRTFERAERQGDFRKFLPIILFSYRFR